MDCQGQFTVGALSFVLVDLTSNSLLVDYEKVYPRWTTKVCDFNLSKVVEVGQSMVAKNSGTMNSVKWQSPELLSGKLYGKPNDVFSFAVVLWEYLHELIYLRSTYSGKPNDVFSFTVMLWEVITLNVPWSDENMMHHRFELIDIHVSQSVREGTRLELPEADAFSPRLGREHAEKLLSLTRRCWSHDPQLRPEMDQIATELSNLLSVVRAENFGMSSQRIAGDRELTTGNKKLPFSVMQHCVLSGSSSSIFDTSSSSSYSSSYSIFVG
eukprot:gene9777-7660_t